ncbi:uncharacterized protein N7477_006432 [Penicillium maclennaniae]|uniref:uncharacterized protein n=1 Tax=Penicillium maclennaniae TaxID=1343394 RepID=UPI00254079A4|nr:uncharacterized protein N7477_006432 [Penicillium maclennaniae]KAJ5667862.1 hypothetical protein N7477_006432 [Penicillium maclennaniae]
MLLGVTSSHTTLSPLAMGIASTAIYFILHPYQLGVLVQWKLRNGPMHKRGETQESATAKICFNFLDQTGRSFSPVIQELHPELLLPVCVFYLILRGLDTIEDDTSIPLDVKEPLLRDFKDHLDHDGWTFTGNRPEEKDRELLVQFDNVIVEYRKLKQPYQAIIKSTTDKMGNGMADFARKAAFGDISVSTVEEYDLYCWHVAGIVGEGLTYLFFEAGLADTTLINHSLYRSMGLFLQKNNIIRDIREDFDDGRQFWPREIWSKHVDNFEDLFDPRCIEDALNCGSEMVLNALGHACDCLSYIAGLREQSVFNFCAIPQAMALATLELCFRNPTMFEQNVKITKGAALNLMTESSQDSEGVVVVFWRYARRIQQKNDPKDPNFLKISIIEKFAETLAPKSVERTRRKEQKIGSSTGRVVLTLTIASVFTTISVMILFPSWVHEWYLLIPTLMPQKYGFDSLQKKLCHTPLAIGSVPIRWTPGKLVD